MFIGAVVTLVVVGGLVAWRWWDEESRLASAVAQAPADSQRITWTDWAGVRAELDADLADATGEDLATFLDRGYDADLTSASAIRTSAEELRAQFGLSPATLSWELLAQAPDGQVLLLGLPEDFDYDALRERLRSLGYTEPDREGGTWRASEVTIADLALTPELGNMRVDEEAGLVATSETPAYLEQWSEERRGDDVDDGIDDVVGAYDEATPLSGVVYSGDQACNELAMSRADAADRARADQLIAAAGEVHPLRGYAMVELAGGAVRVAMVFEDEDRARTNADTRSQLAAGPAPGQGGAFSDRFRLGEVSARGDVVRMELDPVDGAYVVSDLSSGPVLFATC